MPKIVQLDPHVADLIAAGEVVERPASVVKELTENAIDAGATSVTVEIQRGGMSYIRVADNGCGIAPEDCLTAFLRHATSKIRTEYDLEAIGTLGFRGEALAAIAAVSRVELMTSTADAPSGTSLVLEAGVVRERGEVGCPRGTTFIVRDLFFNTPARQKFMKKDSAEGSAVFAVVQHAALSHPEVSFRFLREGREELFTSGDGSLKNAVYAVLGREVALGLIPCRGSGEEIQVEGFVSKPVCCRGSRAGQFFFVNGRYVKSRTMQAALEQAYANRKMVGKFPSCVLHLATRLSGVDVNVHPTKTEVKFTSEKRLFDAVYYAAMATLDAQADTPKAVLEAKKPEPAVEKHDHVTPNQTFFRTLSARQFRNELRSEGAAEYHAAGRRPESRTPIAPATIRPMSAEPERPAPQREVPDAVQQTPLHPSTAPTVESAAVSRTAPPAAENVAPMAGREPEPAQPRLRPTLAAAEEPAAPVAMEPPAGPTGKEPPVRSEEAAAPLFVECAPQEAAETEGAPSLDVPAEESFAPAELVVPQGEGTAEPAREDAPDAPDWRMVGEVLNTYIIVERGEEVWFIDKHAAHERLNFDRLKAMHHRPMGQLLLTPQVLRPEPEEREILLEHLPLLKEFAFEVEDFGGGSLLVRECPDYVGQDQIESVLEDIASRLLTTGTADPDAARDEVLHSMACKAAIKGGWTSGREELETLCRAVMSDQIRHCPHGRPVAVQLTRKELEKQFKRA